MPTRTLGAVHCVGKVFPTYSLLASLGIYQGTAFANGHVRVVDVAGGASVQIDADGAAGAATFRPLATLRGVSAAAIDPVRDLGL